MAVKTAICEKVTYLDRKIEKMRAEGRPLREVDAYDKAIERLEDTLLDRRDEILFEEYMSENLTYQARKKEYDTWVSNQKKLLLDSWTKAADRYPYFYRGSTICA